MNAFVPIFLSAFSLNIFLSAFSRSILFGDCGKLENSVRRAHEEREGGTKQDEAG